MTEFNLPPVRKWTSKDYAEFWADKTATEFFNELTKDRIEHDMKRSGFSTEADYKKYLYEFDLALARPKVISFLAKIEAKQLQADGKNFGLLSALHTGNRVFRLIFEKETGLKLPKNNAATQKFLIEWAKNK